MKNSRTPLKKIPTLVLAVGCLSLSSQASDVFESYRTLSVQLAKTVEDRLENESTLRDSSVLLGLGKDIMKLYAEKNPACKEQYDMILQELETLEVTDLHAFHERYHNGVGLPQGPRHCYFGRSLAIHPIMNQVRFKEGLTDQEREEVVDEFKEVSRHVLRAKANIENPPNP